MDELHGRRGPSALTVGDLVHTLGTVVIRAVPTAVGLGNIASGPVIFDPMDELPDSPGGVLLMVGLAPDSPQVSTTMPAAAKRGYSALVVKARGQPLHDVADAARTAGIALLVVDEAVSWRHLDRLIVSVTSSHSRNDHPNAAGSGDLFVLANAIATALKGAVAIEDLDRNVLAYSNLEEHKVDRMRRIGILARRVPDMDKNIRQYRELLLADGVLHFPYDDTDGELPRCAVAVRAGRQPVGSIWVIEADQPVGPEGETALQDACRLAAIHILQAQSAVDVERQLRAEWLRSLLEGHGSLAATATRFGIAADVPSVVVGFTFPAGGGPSPLLPQLSTAVEQYCSVFLTNVSCIAIGRTVYVLFPSVRDDETPRRVATGASKAVEARLGHPARAAISSAGRGPSALHQLRREVDQILAVIGSVDSAPSVATASDIYAQILLTTLGREFTRNETPLHSGVQALLDHDRARGTEYRSTLCTYFGAMGDVAETARQLNIHPNTLRYRLRRAAVGFGVPLGYPDDILTTWLQLRLAPSHDGRDGRP